MKNFETYFKKGNRIKALLVFGVFFLISFSSDAGAIRDINKAVERVQSIQRPFQFAVLGDSRDGDKVYAGLLKRILARKPDFVIHLGDMVPAAHQKNWDVFFKISKPITVPFFPVVGNHDVNSGNPGEMLYQNQFFLPEGKTYYAFRAGEVLFVFLDSEKVRCRIAKEQRLWLGHVLASSNEKMKLVFIHRPLFVPLDSLKMGRTMDKYSHERDDLHRLFLKNKVRAVFEADDHRYDRGIEDGILYVITGGGGAPLYTNQRRGGFFHYLWISVQKGKIEGEVADMIGGIRDRFVIE